MRKLVIALLIVLISTYSFNARQSVEPDLPKIYFDRGVNSLRILNYLDALYYFSQAYRADPKSYYGELAYLYLGKSYALYSYAYGSREGIFASIGYLNQYPFHYKVPRFIHTQREFVGDSYLLLQWYETAKNIYANLYGETEKVEYMIKFGYASSLQGSIEGYSYLKDLNLKTIPADYLDLYYTTMGFYNFNLGRYKLTIEYLSYAMNVNAYLREDPHLLFRIGVAYYKLGDWRRSLLYLELTIRRDVFRIYRERTSFYLAFLNLETKNFREAYLNIRELTNEDSLFYSKLAQIVYSSLWYYEDFLEVYADAFTNYEDNLIKLAWLNIEDVYGELPLLGVYYFSLKKREIPQDRKEIMRIKNLTLSDFIYENELFTFGKYTSKLKRELGSLAFFKKEDASFVRELYLTNESNYLRVFQERGVELLARSLVFLGDERAEEAVKLLRDENLKMFLRAKLHLIEDRTDEAIRLLKKSLRGLKDKDLLEAKLLLAYLGDDEKLLREVAKEDITKDERLSFYAPLILLKLADLLYMKGELEQALELYIKVTKLTDEGDSYWWSLFRIAVISEAIGDSETLKWVVKEVKDKDNIWSRTIRTLWEG